MPLPWAFDWAGLRHIDAEAATQLSSLFRHWSQQQLEMRWLSGENLFITLQEAAPTGVRDADPAFWQARLDALKLANRADQFDEAAIDYCVTYEVSPPSWERTRCSVRISGSGMHTHTPPLSMVSEVSTGFMESGLIDDGAGTAQVASIELSGQLVGDIGETLERLNAQLGKSQVVSVSCAKLIRVDFIAAGDLLNWVLVRRGEKRMVQFVDAHRLVALFFGAMGINEHAKVQVRKV
jgi:ABC-type transporter Mla MlaB component